MNQAALAVIVISVVLLVLLFINYRIFRFRTLDKLSVQYKQIERDKERISELKEALEKKTSELELLNGQLFESQLSGRALNILHQKIKRFLNALLNESSFCHTDECKLTILDLSRQVLNYIEVEQNGKSQVEVKKEVFNMNEQVNRLIHKYDLVLKRKNLSIKNDMDNKVKIHADKYLFERIFENFLDNACSFSPENGLISIYTEELDNKIKVHVMDEGPGIPSKHHVSVFNKYITLGKYNVKGNTTAGLGLVFCKEAASLNGGETGVNSHLNMGTDFWFTVEMSADKK